MITHPTVPRTERRSEPTSRCFATYWLHLLGRQCWNAGWWCSSARSRTCTTASSCRPRNGSTTWSRTSSSSWRPSLDRPLSWRRSPWCCRLPWFRFVSSKTANERCSLIGLRCWHLRAKHVEEIIGAPASVFWIRWEIETDTSSLRILSTSHKGTMHISRRQTYPLLRSEIAYHRLIGQRCDAIIFASLVLCRLRRLHCMRCRR